MPKMGSPRAPSANNAAIRYVGTIVGESTSREFRLALAHEAVREQDIIAVNAEMRRTDVPTSAELILLL